MSNNRNVAKNFRFGLQCFANVCTLIAVSLVMAAMFTSAWKVTYIDINFTSIYEHGLYRDCVKGRVAGMVAIASYYPWANDYLCFWKFDQFNNQIRAGGNLFWRIRDFQKTVFILLGVSCGLAFATMICACTTCLQKFCNILWAVSGILTTAVAIVGAVVFAQNAGIGYGGLYANNDYGDYGVNNYPFQRTAAGARWLAGGRGRYLGYNRLYRMDYYDDYGGMNGGMNGYYGNAWYGFSFYLCIAGIVVHALVFVLACICTCLSFVEAKRQRAEKIIITSNESLCSISRTNSTSSFQKAVHGQGSYDFDF